MSEKKPTKRPLFVIDIDGTLANTDARIGLIRNDSPNWDLFFAKVLEDTAVEASQAHFRAGRFVHGHHVFLTARPELVRAQTATWLYMHGFAHTPDLSPHQLMMKPDHIRLLRSPLFKVAALQTMARFDSWAHELILIEDYGAVRDAVEDAGFRTLHAPDCWEAWPL